MALSSRTAHYLDLLSSGKSTTRGRRPRLVNLIITYYLEVWADGDAGEPVAGRCGEADKASTNPTRNGIYLTEEH